jgi:magnesium transporter
MRLSSLLGPDLKATLETEPDALVEALEEFHPEDVAEILDDIPLEDAVAVLRLLPGEQGADVLERLDIDRQVEVLNAFGPRHSIPIVTEMAPDDLVDLVQDMPEELAEQLLDEMQKEEPEAAEEVRELSAWDEDSAGGLMTPEFVGLAPDMKVWQAIDEVRRLGAEDEAETIYYIYVVAFGKLVGVLSLRQLILADPGQELRYVMNENVVRVGPRDDQEKVASAIAKYDINAIPVVDEQGNMLGVVTVDDVVDVVIEEATEVAHKMGGVVPLEDSYFDTGFVEFIWKRAIWLIILFGGQLLTATVMEHHEATIAAVAGLVVFIPLIIATGGNSGSQSSSLVIRALAVGEMTPRDWSKVALREGLIGLFIGLLLGAVGFVRAWFVGDEGSLNLAVSVGASIVAIVTLGTLTGSLLPLGMRRVGLDPAVSSTPFIASLVDVLGLIVYFAIAQAIFFATLS